MRRLSLILSLLLLLALVIAPFALLGTAPGARGLAALAERYLPVRIEGVQGSVASGLRLDAVTYREGDREVDLRDLGLAVDLSCVLRSVVCIDFVGAASVRVRLPEPERSEEPLNLRRLFRSMPAITVEALEVAHLSVALGAQEETLASLELAGALDRSGLRVQHLSGCHEVACLTAAGEFAPSSAWSLSGDLRLGVGIGKTLTDAGVVLPSDFDWGGSGTGNSAQLAIEGKAPSEFAAELEARFDDGITVTADVSDLNAILPALAQSPWTQVSGALEVQFALRGGVLELGLQETVSGYAAAAVPLSINLRREGAEWLLTQGSLGQADAPLLTVQGVLGAIGDLRPELAFSAQGLRLPVEAGWNVQGIVGSGDLSFALSDALGTWSVTLRDLELQEGVRTWRASGQLIAASDSLLPSGEMDVHLFDETLASVSQGFQYTRDGEADTAALITRDGLDIGDLRLEKLTLSVRPGEQTKVLLSSSGDVATDLSFMFRMNDAGVQGTLNPFELSLQGAQVRSGRGIPLSWRRDTDSLSLGPLCLQVRDSELCSDSLDLASEGELSVRADVRDRYDGLLADVPYSAEVEALGELSLVWKEWRPTTAEVDFEVSGLAVDPYAADAGARTIHWHDGQVAATYGLNGVTSRLRLASPVVGVLEGELAVTDERLEGRFAVDELSLAAISDLLPEARLVDGAATADLIISGSVSSPRVTGRASIEDATIGVDLIDAQLEELNAFVNFYEHGAEFEGQGVLGGGSVGFQASCCDQNGVAGTFIGSTNRLRLPVGLDVSMSPSLDFFVDPRRLSVTGSLVVHDGVFEHSGLADGGVDVSSDVVRVDGKGAGSERFELDLDIRALIEPGFVLRSRRIESTLSGDLRFLKQPRTPASLYGNLEVLGGELRVYGQALRLTDGSLGFVGDPINPDLSISAEREIRTDNQRVGFRMSGTLEDPLLELFSEPQRSNDETLSYLLRGRPPDVGVSTDDTAMALSLGASAVNQSGVLSGLNSIPGLSGVSLGAEGRDDETTATISAYVGNRLYLSYGFGIYEPINALTARLYLRSRLWLEVVSRLENSIDLYYRFDRN